MPKTPLTVLDLVPISSGSTAIDALRNSIDLAVRTEQLGYARYWFAEHHLNPGVAGTSPAVVLALTAAATSTIRIGSGAVQMGHRTALSVVEEFGLLDAFHPGRIDLGLGRSAGRPPGQSQQPALVGAGAAVDRASADGTAPVGRANGTAPVGRANGTAPVGRANGTAPVGRANGTAPGGRSGGLTIPARVSLERLLGSPRFTLQKQLLMQPGAQPQGYTQQVDDVLALIAGTYVSQEGAEAHVVPGEGAALQLWILGSSGGESAIAAGERGMRFAANYHVSPATVLEAADGYRAAFRPSAELDEPHVSVSADVVVADDEPTARELAAGYGSWVYSIRSGAGAISFPTPEEARANPLSDEQLALVTDRIDTQFVGSPGQVADHLEVLRDATGADALIVTTITHDHADRVRSYELLAAEWERRGG